MSAGGLRGIPRESKLVIGLVSGSEFVNHMNIVLIPPILGLLAGEFGVSFALLGVAVGLQAGATTIFQLPFGYLSDRYSRTVGLGLSIGLGSIGAFVTALAPSLAVLAVGQFILGVGVAGHHPSHYPLLSEAVPEEYRARSFSIRGFTGALGFATPPTVTTIVLAFPGASWRHAVGLMGAFGLVYGVVALTLFRRYVDRDVKVPSSPARDDPIGDVSIRERVRAEIDSIASAPAILALAFLTLVTTLVSNGFKTYVVVHLTDAYGVALGAANLTLTAMFVGGAFAMLLGGALADRVPAGTVIVTAYVLVTIFVLTISTLLVPAALAMAVAVGVRSARGSAGPARDKLIDRLAPEGATGQSFAVMTVGMMLGSTIAPPVFGAAIDVFGLQAAFAGMALAAFAGLGLAVVVVLRHDEEFTLRRPLGSVTG